MQINIQPKQFIIYFITLFCAAITLYIFHNQFYPFYFPIDDAYIFLHNAQVLHIGYDQNYHATPALYGTTSLIHLALVALNLFWFSPLHAVFAVQCVTIFLYLFGLLRLTFIFNANLIQTIAFLIVGATIGLVPYHLLSGMDTALCMVVILWSLIFAQTYRIKLSQYLLPILCGFMPFVRPELSLLSMLLISYQLKINYSSPDFKRKFLIIIALALIAAMPWSLWNWLDTGNVIPETILAKINFFAELYYPLQVKLHVVTVGLSKFLLSCGYITLLGSSIFLLRTSVGRIGFIFIIILFTVYLFIYPTAAFDNKGRYVYITLPIFLFGMISVIQDSKKYVKTSSYLLIIYSLIFSVIYLPIGWQTYLSGRNNMIHDYNAAAQWCNQHLPANTRILVHDAGYISFATSFQLIDLVGLKTPTSVAFHHKLTLPTLGSKRFEAISEIIKYNKPDYLVVSTNVLYGLADDLTHREWKLKPLYVPKQGFGVYQIQYP